MEKGHSGEAGPGLLGAGNITFLVLVRARSGQVRVEAQSVGPRLLKVQNYVSLKAELVYVSLALIHRAPSASLPLLSTLYLSACLLSAFVVFRFNKCFVSATLLLHRLQESFRLQKLCGNGSDKRKTTIE